jgi:tRNA U34 5-methylaminomethyl-2-thiouridine-forming methyltransferase MnmC
MTWPGCGPDDPADLLVDSDLRVRTTADGSFSLFSQHFGEAFHAAAGALSEARATFVGPAELQRFTTGTTLVVVDVCVGTGSNSAALLEAAAERGLQLCWRGLELDPHPLQLALADAGFCGQWRPEAFELLRQLAAAGSWRSPLGSGVMLWGDARVRLPALLDELSGQVDLVLMDAFSPRHCPELWTLEFLGGLARLLGPQGRLLTYCSAAAVRAALLQAGLQLAAIAANGRRWSGGTAGSPTLLPDDHGIRAEALAVGLRPLTTMELEHLATNAAVPYRDSTGQAAAAAILVERERRQRELLMVGELEPTSAWRRRWGLK